MVKISKEKQEAARISESKIKKMNMLGQLSFGIAHDIRNSLQIIKSSSILMRKHSDDPYILKNVDAIDAVVQNTANMLERLLSFSNKSHNLTGDVELSGTIEDILGLAELLVPPYIKLEYGKPEVEMNIVGDATEITQALLNLIKNASDAIEATQRSGIINISLRECFPWIELKVGDNGSGIQKEHLETIFDPLFTTKDDGTGLGLANVQATVDSHGGTISVQSNAGDGAEFIIMLPKKI